jgi:hypothetical protein
VTSTETARPTSSASGSVGRWKVALSDGNGFAGPPAEWAYGQGAGTAKQWVADLNGNGKADTITFDSTTGDWYASLSTGTGFGPSQQLWADGFGYGSNHQAVGDFTGDGKADLGAYWTSNGTWYVTPSGTTPPFSATQWSYQHGLSSNERLVGDVNGGGKADECFFFSSNGHWDCGMSSGSGFYAPTAWAHGHGVGTDERFLADVNNDGKADIITFDVDNGDWWVSTSSGSGFWSPQQWITGYGKNS